MLKNQDMHLLNKEINKMSMQMDIYVMNSRQKYMQLVDS